MRQIFSKISGKQGPNADKSCDVAICADEAEPLECKQLEDQGVIVLDQLEVKKKLKG